MTAAKSKKTKESEKKKHSETKKSNTSSKKTSSAKKSPAKKTVSKKTAAKKKTEKKTSAQTTSSKSSQKNTTSVKKSSSKKSPASSSKKKTTTKKKKNSAKRNQSHPEFPTTEWGENTIISFEATEHLPTPELTSIAGGFIFHNGQLVLANVPGRGWEIIGGRIDVGESPEDTFRREAYNQVGAILSHVKMIGLVRIEHTGPEPPNCPYPFPVGYGVNFIGIVESLEPFVSGSDSLGRSLISPDGFKQHYYDWNEYYEAVFRYALKEYQKLKKKLKL